MVTLRICCLVPMTVGAMICGLGCTEAETSKAKLEIVPLGCSNGYALIQHTNGKLYTIRLDNGEALEVWDIRETARR